MRTSATTHGRLIVNVNRDEEAVVAEFRHCQHLLGVTDELHGKDLKTEL
jgi:hypothetical protein